MATAPIVREVSGRRELKAFIRYPWTIYRSDPCWVPPLLLDEKKLFVRGDADANGSIQITDGVVVLGGLFLGRTIPCRKAADTDDDGYLCLTDAIRIFVYLFQSGEVPPPPGPSAAQYAADDCHMDPTEDDLTCETVAAKCR